MKRLVLFLCAFLGATTLFALTETVNGVTWTFTVTERGAIIETNSRTAAIPTTTTGSLLVPTILGQRAVVEIGSYAFDGCSKLTKVIIPEGITTLGNEAFAYCSALRTVVLPKTMTTIGITPFYHCEIQDLFVYGPRLDKICATASINRFYYPVQYAEEWENI